MLYNVTRLIFLINSYWYLFCFQKFLLFPLSQYIQLNTALLFIIGSYSAKSVLISSLNRITQRAGSSQTWTKILPISLLNMSWLLQCKYKLIVFHLSMCQSSGSQIWGHYVRSCKVTLMSDFNRSHLDSHICFCVQFVAMYCFSGSI